MFVAVPRVPVCTSFGAQPHQRALLPFGPAQAQQLLQVRLLF